MIMICDDKTTGLRRFRTDILILQNIWSSVDLQVGWDSLGQTLDITIHVIYDNYRRNVYFSYIFFSLLKYINISLRTSSPDGDKISKRVISITILACECVRTRQYSDVFSTVEFRAPLYTDNATHNYMLFRLNCSYVTRKRYSYCSRRRERLLALACGKLCSFVCFFGVFGEKRPNFVIKRGGWKTPFIYHVHTKFLSVNLLFRTLYIYIYIDIHVCSRHAFFHHHVIFIFFRNRTARATVA